MYRLSSQSVRTHKVKLDQCEDLGIESLNLKFLIKLCGLHFSAAPPAEAPIQENGEANGEVKEPVDPNAPKKCDVIVISGRKERCDAAVEALKVRIHSRNLFNFS